MYQGKMEVVKQEMARVSTNILGISELKWTRMGEFNSDDHYIYYCGQESLERNGVALIVNRSFLVAQTVKCLPRMREIPVQSLGRGDPLEKEMATHSSILAWKIPWAEDPGRLQSMGLQRVGHD